MTSPADTTVDDGTRWSSGQCGTYACALLSVYPERKLAAMGYDEGDGTVEYQHFCVYDDNFAYDSAGTHPLPYLGVNAQFDYVAGDQDPLDWGLPFDECGLDAEADLALALDYARRLGQVP